jgi:hypothetical protein
MKLATEAEIATEKEMARSPQSDMSHFGFLYSVS